MRRIVICGLPDCIVFFPHDFRKKIELKICVLIFRTAFSETLLILKRTEREMIKMYVGLPVKYPLFLLHFNET